MIFGYEGKVELCGKLWKKREEKHPEKIKAPCMIAYLILKICHKNILLNLEEN